MKKLIFLFLIINSSLFAQHTNTFRDSTVFTKALTLTPGASSGKVLTSDAAGNATWQTSVGGWSLVGNAGTDPATNFIGTTDGQPFNIACDSIISILYKNGEVGIMMGSGFGAGDSVIYIGGQHTFISAADVITITGDAGAACYNETDTIIDTCKTRFISADIITLTGVIKTLVKGNVQIQDGTQGAGKVLTSDANGLASWSNRLIGNDYQISDTTNYNFQIGNLTAYGGGISDLYIQTIHSTLAIDTLIFDGTHIRIKDGTQGAGKVLTSDANGYASWQGGIVYDSLTSLTGETVTLTNNSTTIIASNGTITDVTWSFPTGSTGDVLDIENMQTIATLNITGTGTGTITAAKITNTKTAGLKTFHNYGGNWY